MTQQPNIESLQADITDIKRELAIIKARLDTGGEFVNVKQACNLLGISDTTFRKYRKLYPHIFPAAYGSKRQPRYFKTKILSFWKKVGKVTPAKRSNPNTKFLKNQSGRAGVESR